MTNQMVHEWEQFICPRCGGELEDKDTHYLCRHCERKWKKNTADSYDARLSMQWKRH